MNATREEFVQPGAASRSSVSVPALLVAALPPLALAAIVTLTMWPGIRPGVAWWDTGEFQVIAPVLGTGHAPGFPTYVLIGWVVNLLLTPLGEPAFRMNVMSVLTVALAAAFLLLTVRRLFGSTLVAAVAGFGMATTALVWLQATHAEPHTLHLAFVGLLFLLLVEWARRRRIELGRAPDGADLLATDLADPTPRPMSADRWLVAAAVVFGLSSGNHGLTFILAPAVILYVLAVDPRSFVRPKLIVACGLASVGTLALVYLELPIRAGILRAPVVYGRPDTWDGFWYVVLATQFHGLILDPLANLPEKAGQLVNLAVVQFGVLAIFIPFGFAATIRATPRFAVLSGASMAITLFWNSFFNDGYIDRYYLGPIFWAWTWLAILGALVVARLRELVPSGRGASETSASSPRAIAPTAIAVLVALALLVPGFSNWDVKSGDVRGGGADRSGETDTARWLNAVLPVLKPDALVVSWWSTSTPLWYAQHVEGRRQDVFVVDDRTMLDLELGRAPDVLDGCLAVRPVYAIRANDNDLQELLDQFDMTLVAAEGSVGVYEVHGRRAGTPAGPMKCPAIGARA